MIDRIMKASKDFRNALDLCKGELGESFSLFPRGACGDSTDLLGTYLKEKGLGEYNYMYGSCGIHGTHAWLQKDDLIIDITADQFDDIKESVIVTRKSIWHDRWDGISSSIASIDNIHVQYRPEEMYKKIALLVEYKKSLINEAVNGELL
jgi:hypothetical protein